MSSIANTSHMRRMIRKSTKRRVRQKVKTAVAQQLVLEGMQKRTVEPLLGFASRKEMREIIELYESYKDEFISIQKEIDRRIIKEGYFVKSRKDVHTILKNHRMLDKKGRLNEFNAGEFAIDMLFGAGPAISDALVPFFPAAKLATFGLGIAGMAYYAFKINSTIRSGEHIDAFFHTIGFIFSAGAAFPGSPFGGLAAGIGKVMTKILEVMFFPIKALFGLVRGPGGSILSSLYRASALGFEKEAAEQTVKAGASTIVKQAEKEGAEQVGKAIVQSTGKEVVEEVEEKAVQKVVQEVEEKGAEFTKELAKNSKVTKFFATLGEGGAKLAKKGIDLLQKAVGYLKDVRLVGGLFAKLEPVLVKVGTSLESFGVKMANLANIQASAAKDGTKGMAMALNFAEGEAAREISEGYLRAQGENVAKAEIELMVKCGFITEQRAALVAASKTAEEQVLKYGAKGVGVIDQVFADDIVRNMLPNIEKFAAKEGLSQAEKEAAEALITFISKNMNTAALDSAVNSILREFPALATDQVFRQAQEALQKQLFQKMVALEAQIYRNMSATATQALERSLAEAIKTSGRKFVLAGEDVIFRGLQTTGEGIFVKLTVAQGRGQTTSKIITRSLEEVLINPKAGGLIDTAMENATKQLDNLMPEILGDPKALDMMDDLIPLDAAAREISEQLTGELGEEVAEKTAQELTERTTEVAIEQTARNTQQIASGVKEATTQPETRNLLFKIFTSSGEQQAKYMDDFIKGLKSAGRTVADDAAEKGLETIGRSQARATSGLAAATLRQTPETASDIADFAGVSTPGRSRGGRLGTGRSGRIDFSGAMDMSADDLIQQSQSINESLRRKNLKFLY